jgi:hypothetical protein
MLPNLRPLLRVYPENNTIGLVYILFVIDFIDDAGKRGHRAE